MKNKPELTVISLVVAVCIILGLNAHHRQEALAECIEDISNKCGATISYALALESENARLNSELKKCTQLETPLWVKPRTGD